MDFATLLIGGCIFLVIYNGVGLFLESRRSASRGFTASTSQGSSRSLRDFTSSMGKMGFNKVILENKNIREKMELLLVRSGYVLGWKPADFLFYKELMAVVGVFIAWQYGTTNPIALVGAGALGFMLPEFYVKAKGSARRAEIQRALPGFIDLVALVLESGLDLLAAVERIVTKMKAGALREELQTLIQENRLGTPRKEALQHLAYRVDLQDIQSLTSLIIQSEELGTSLGTVLRNYAEDMRSRRILRAEEVAGKAPVKLLFPMMVFFFPIIFVIIFGPLALNFMSTYK